MLVIDGLGRPSYREFMRLLLRNNDMQRMINAAVALMCTFSFLARATDCGAAQHDPLPSWNDGATKSAVTDFVQRVTNKSSPDYVRPAERIAVFDRLVEN